MKVTIQQVANGFLITTADGEVFVANKLEAYTYNSFTVVEVLKTIFESNVTELAEAA